MCGFRRGSRVAVSGSLLKVIGISVVIGSSLFAFAKGGNDDGANHRWQAGANRHARDMATYPDADSGEQRTPPVIRSFERAFDPSGLIATVQPSGPTETSQNAFFENLGTNDRTCFTCHQPQTGWTVSAASVQARFYVSDGSDPIFRLVDGATCPSDDVSSVDAKLDAYSLLLQKGLLRIGLPVPPAAEFRVVAVNDPYNCTTNPNTGLTSMGPSNATTGIVSVYRRPLPATNLGFLSAIMWDGREPSLLSQAVDATLGHAQAAAAPTAAQQQQIVDFESGIFTAQSFDNRAKLLTGQGATGGPQGLQNQLAGFFIGINDPLGLNPVGTAFSSKVFDLYESWRDVRVPRELAADRRSVARGEDLFNNMRINITNVAGLNDALGQASIPGFCGTCHDAPNVGDHSVKAPLDIGIADAGAGAPPMLNISGLPVFDLQCVAGPLAGKVFSVTDPGRALISGKCADIGKLKGPILRGLAARAPYFHNGSAATLLDVVNFYDQRFSIGLTDAEKRDLAAFLQTL